MHRKRKRSRGSQMVCECDLGEGELPAVGSLVPDVGEAPLLLEGLSAVSARQIHPAAKDDSVAEVADEGCLNGVWVRGSAGMAYELDQPGLVQ
jgi:hypothetical protein